MKVISENNNKKSLNNVNIGKEVKIYDFVNAYSCTIDDYSKIGAFVEIQKNAFIGKNCKIFPNAVNLIGGLFIRSSKDPEDYVEKFLKGCEVAKIPTRDIQVQEVLKIEKELNKNILRAFQVPDALIYPEKLFELLAKEIRA